MEHGDTTTILREFYVIKFKKDNQEVYWTESKKQVANYTVEFSRAKKYKIYDEAKTKASQIRYANNIKTYVVRYIESIRETYTDVCLEPSAFRSNLNNSDSITIRKDELD